MRDEIRRYWDEQAATFDDEADHGLRDPAVRRAWGGLLLPLLPSAPARVADLGYGTGSLSLMLAEAGHDVQVSTGAGLAAADCQALVRRHREEAQVRMLREASYWGKDIADERYLLVSSR